MVTMIMIDLSLFLFSFRLCWISRFHDQFSTMIYEFMQLGFSKAHLMVGGICYLFSFIFIF